MAICSNKPLQVVSKPSMKPILAVTLAAALFTVGCQKQESEADRKAEIERQVQERLAAERQAQEQQRLNQGQVDLDKPVQDLENGQNATATPGERVAERERPERDSSDSDQERMRDEPEDQGGSSYSTFYTRLEPEGDWIETSNYGYVWQPGVARQSHAWRPYTNGRWVYTDAGWTWISEEPFGWATYHYGRWTRLRSVGWVWVPGSEWAPAWVSWRTSNDYIGWAPLPPEARFERRSGIHNWADSYYDIGPDQYCFVQTSNLGEERLERAIVPAERNVTIVNQTVNVTNITYSHTMVINNGPNYDEVRGRSQRPIERLRLDRQRSANVNAGDLRPVVRGEVVQMAAPVFARAQSVERPRTVRENISQAVVEHGWENVADKQAAEQARAKIRNEATPPPNAPSRTFVRPGAGAVPEHAATTAASPSSSAAGTPVPTSSAVASPRGSVSRVRPGSPVETPSPVSTPRSTPIPESSPSVSSTPVRALSPETTPSPLHRPNRMMSPSPGATLSPATTPSPATSMASPVPRKPMPDAQNQAVSPTPTPQASPSAVEGTTAHITPRGRGDRPVPKGPVYRDRQLNALTPPAAASAPPSAPGREEKREEGRARRGNEQPPAAGSPTSSPSATP